MDSSSSVDGSAEVLLGTDVKEDLYHSAFLIIFIDYWEDQTWFSRILCYGNSTHNKNASCLCKRMAWRSQFQISTLLDVSEGSIRYSEPSI